MLVATPLLLLGAVSPWATRLRLDDGRGGGVGRRAAVRDLDDRLARRRVLRGAVVDRGDRHPAHVHRARHRARAGGRARPRRPRADRPGGAGRGAVPPAGHDEAGRRGRASCSRRRRRTSTRAWSSGRTARAGWSSTKARRSTRCGGPGTVLTGGYWDGFLVLPFATGTGKPPERIAALGTAGGTVPRGIREVLPRHADRRGRHRPRAVRDRAPVLRPRGAAAAARDRRRTRGRSCARPRSATTRSSSTPTASPTSRST